VVDGRWTSTFDVIVFSYLIKINVITDGNYMNGFSVQSSKTYFNTINPHSPFFLYIHYMLIWFSNFY